MDPASANRRHGRRNPLHFLSRSAGAGSSRAALARVRLAMRLALSGRSVQDVIVLAMRLVGARSMSVVTLVVAAWLVDIEAFAAFGVYQTLAALAWVALFLRYDAAVVAAASDAEAGRVLRLCAALGLGLWGVFSTASLAAGGLGLMRLDLAALLPLSILARGMLRLSFATATRDGDFKGIGRASLAQSLAQPTILVALVLSPLDDVLCFAAADIAGHATGVAYLAFRRRSRRGLPHGGFRLEEMAATARRWRSLPLYNLPGSFLSLAFVMSPLLITPLTADPVFAGHVALAYRIFDVPTQIVTAASTPIFLNRLRSSELRPGALFGRHIMLGLTVLVGMGYALLATLAAAADPWLGATELAGLAEAVPTVALFQLFVAVGAPVGDSLSLYPQQRRQVVIQGLAVLAAVGFAVLPLPLSPEGLLWAMGAVAGLRALALGELLRTLSSLNSGPRAPAAVIPARPDPCERPGP